MLPKALAIPSSADVVIPFWFELVAVVLQAQSLPCRRMRGFVGVGRGDAGMMLPTISLSPTAAILFDIRCWYLGARSLQYPMVKAILDHETVVER
jgi:hypothetical protein